MAKANAVRNGLDGKMDFVCEDVFDLLTKLAEQKCHDYDYIILDRRLYQIPQDGAVCRPRI